MPRNGCAKGLPIGGARWITTEGRKMPRTGSGHAASHWKNLCPAGNGRSSGQAGPVFSQMRKKAYLCSMDFAQILRQRYGLSDEGIGRLMEHAALSVHARKETVIEEGQRDPDVCFVAEGSVRTYVMREDKCVIFSFSFEGDPATSTLGTQPSGISRQTIETMEPTTLVRIPRASMDALFARDVELADWGRRMAEEQLRRHEDYFADYAWRDKREQYERMLREYPQLLQRIALKDLAAYLFLTPQSLSRIRAGVK